MKTMLNILMMGILIVSGAYARLGETVEICKERYGQPISMTLNDDETGVAAFYKNDLNIKLHFTKGKADLIQYRPGEVHRIDLEIAKELLGRNGRTKEWEQTTKTEETLYDVRDLNAQHARTQLVDPIRWRSKDGLLEASFSNGKGTLEIKSATEQEKLLQDL